jgi:hypothetical protein
LAALGGLIEGKKAAKSEQAQVAACKEILDRAYGKSAQAVTINPGDRAVDFTTERLVLIDGKTRGLPRHAAAAPGPALISFHHGPSATGG